MPTKSDRIRDRAIEILKENPQGKRYSELLHEIRIMFPNERDGTIRGSIWNLDLKRSNEVFKVERGLFRHSNYRDASFTEKINETYEEQVTPDKYREEDFYEGFKDYLIYELEECTHAIVLGGNAFKDKWQTPDVIGINRSKRSEIIQHPDEYISAEIKLDDSTQSLITAFGQACAYQIFSHKVYLVIPKSAGLDRIESLCQIFGIGLVLFNKDDKNNPKWEIRTRPIKREPDWFYVNKTIAMEGVYNKLNKEE